MMKVTLVCLSPFVSLNVRCCELTSWLVVTREEPAWESFSEDEPVPSKEPSSSAAASSLKAKKGGGKPGQGNIMSFFGKNKGK